MGDLVRVDKTVQRVETDPIKLMYPQLNNLKDCFLECYADASFGNSADGGSRGGGGGGGVTSYFFLVVLVTDALFHGNQGN